ncbi:hypothetical protein DFH09DRAFT_1161124 [Mycena vulgaris]|nr:hypothetical protein DFH09DRAFT_1161090 [Mycena vulgaris]KAJ6560878.1 hypothetical protein DFH09DRAFT_1161124 [Mycena vulgaris]
MAFTVLANTWDHFDFSNPRGIDHILPLIQCTISTAFITRILPNFILYNPSQLFKDKILVRLGDSLVQAEGKAVEAQPNMPQQLNEALGGVANMLSKLAAIINGELRIHPLQDDEDEWEVVELNYWNGLQAGFYDDLGRMREMFNNLGGPSGGVSSDDN